MMKIIIPESGPGIARRAGEEVGGWAGPGQEGGQGGDWLRRRSEEEKLVFVKLKRC